LNRWGTWVWLAVAALLGANACGGSPTTPGPQPQPPPANNPPVIESLTVSPTRLEVGAQAALTATVRDAETPVASLTYQWSASAGSFTGQSGSSASWRAPEGISTPQDFPLTLTVVEQYGTSTPRAEHRVSSTADPVRVHNSPRELSDMTLAFLGYFADNRVSAADAVRDFADSCSGKVEERADVQRIRDYFQVLSSSFSVRSVNINTAGTQANISAPCSFESRYTACSPDLPGCVVGAIDRPLGECVFTARYESRRWWLCTSNFVPSSTLSPLMRSILVDK
jgi:hypothetical protein